MGPTERLSLHLTKPRNTELKIESFEDRYAVEPLVHYPLPVSSHVRACGPYLVAGTTATNTLRLYNFDDKRLQSPVTSHSAIGFRDSLSVGEKEKHNTQVVRKNLFTSEFSASVVDLSEIMKTSEHVEDEEERSEQKRNFNLHSVYVECVVEEKNTGNQRPSFGRDSSVKRFEPLEKSIDEEQPILHYIINQLPMELHENILKNMDYDQVSWLADVDERFTRLLAKSRYNIDSYDTDKYPDASGLLRQMRRETAKEMQLREDEDMWIVSLDKESILYGEARRYMFQKGTYTWHIASSVTSMRFDSMRSKCQECTSKLDQLEKKMNVNQQAVLTGQSSMKIFALKGTEAVEIEYGYASPMSQKDTVYNSCDRYAIHLWVENLDNRWLLDLRLPEEDVMHVADYKYIQNLKTLIFKDPVKFFGTRKIMERVDDGGIVAITSEKTGETLGYLVNDKEFRFRLPNDSKQRSHFIGLNLLPDTLVEEAVAMNRLVTHVIEHEVDEKLPELERLYSELNQMYEVADEQLRGILHDQLVTTDMNYNRLLSIKIRRYNLLRINIFQETIDNNTLHIHETFEEDIEFCSRYIFNRLGETTSPKKIAQVGKQMFTRCSCERLDPTKICSLKIISPAVLRSIYAVQQQGVLDTDFT